MKINLTENKLKQIVAESVKRVLREVYEPYPLEYGDMYSDKILKKYRNGEYDNLDTFDYGGQIDGELEVDDFKQQEYDNMSNKLPGGGEQLSKLIKNNPIFKKWYKSMHKALENDYSWELYERMKETVYDALKSEQEHYVNNNIFAQDLTGKNYFINDDYYDYDGRHPDSEELYTKDSANRNLRTINKQRKNIK